MQSGAYSDSFEQFYKSTESTFYSWKLFSHENFFLSGTTVGEKRKSAERRNNYRLCTIPHKLCRFEMKDMHGLQSFSSTDSDGMESLLFILSLNQEIFISPFYFQNKIQPFSVQPWQEWILELKSFTTDTRRLKVNHTIIIASLKHDPTHWPMGTKVRERGTQS